MTLRLVIEHSPHPQTRREVRHVEGDLSIGRGADCDWILEDPDMFISRRHCVVSGRDGDYRITDASRGGLYLDGGDRPLGPGNSAPLEPGMRVRMGDVVIRVEMEGEAAGSAPVRRDQDIFRADDFFHTPAEPVETPPRPADLPEPFDSGRPAATGAAAPPLTPRAGPGFDDPFTLDPLPLGRGQVSDPWFDRAATEPEGPYRPDAAFVFDTSLMPPEEASPPIPEARIAPAPVLPSVPARQDDTPAAFVAFLRGAGLSPEDIAANATAEDMERLGRRFRLLAEGLIALLRARAKEKGTARLAQTVIGAADVNPLKFLPTTDEALAALIHPRGRGYLAPDDAISAAFRDLSDHQMRSWAAIQSALRHMIDRFDPTLFEAESDKEGLLKAILAGGRGARLWQLYAERYRDIAKAAEDRFLGEVGGDFRDAYESRGRTKDD